VLFLLETF